MRYLLKSKYCEGAACALTVLLWNVFICSLCGTVTVIFCFIVRDLSPVLLLPLVWLTLHVDCVVMDFYQPGGRLTLVCTFSQGRVSPVPRLSGSAAEEAAERSAEPPQCWRRWSSAQVFCATWVFLAAPSWPWVCEPAFPVLGFSVYFIKSLFNYYIIVVLQLWVYPLSEISMLASQILIVVFWVMFLIIVYFYLILCSPYQFCVSVPC